MSLTLKRVVAYIFDVMVVSLVTSLISMTTINPYYEEKLSVQEDYEKSLALFNDKINELDESDEEGIKNLTEEMSQFYKESTWNINRLAIFENCVSIILIILYFGVFAFFFEGETVGKRLMKIRITKVDDTKVGFGNLLVRLLVLHGIPFTIINILCLVILSKNSYMTAYTIINLLMFVVSLSIVISTLARDDKRGLHDLIARTKVIDYKAR